MTSLDEKIQNSTNNDIDAEPSNVDDVIDAKQAARQARMKRMRELKIGIIRKKNIPVIFCKN